MNFTTLLKRAARGLLGFGVGLALTAGSALAQGPVPTIEKLKEALTLEPAGGGGLHATPRVTFRKVGRQLDCKYVEYRMRFAIQRAPGAWDDPGAQALFDTIPISFRDQLPDGLKAVNATVAGDIKDAGGGAVAPIFDTTVNPDDTVRFSDARISAADLDGDGSNTTRQFYVTILAEIDHAKFPAPTVVDNQARVNVQITDMVHLFPSHDPAVPDDGDPYTGDPTPVLIDITDCPPPPPPPGVDDEPCFVIDTGEVDCDPAGGGALIYKMNVGPEQAGDTIELTPLDPGITVLPASQVVPAGGGVLIWTILGASPGDVLHFRVGDVKWVGGPAEGVGLCCAQTIEIIVPEDLDCPPDEEEEPDLEVLKRADEGWCDQNGPDECDFTIRVRNNGPGDYTGKIVLDEVTLPGNATVTSGPNAPWTCLPLTSPMSCEHPATTLHPGEFVELKLGFTPGPGWAWNFIRNCAEYDYTASGKAPFGDLTNDKACAVINICLPNDPNCYPPETDDKPDIGIRKQADGPCNGDGVCHWNITVFNNTNVPINGPVTVIDEFILGDVASATFSPMPPWNCVPLAGNKFQCDHPNLNLPVMGSSTQIHVVSIDDPAEGTIENCAEVQPLPGEDNLANNKSCAINHYPGQTDGKADLEIEKDCKDVTAAGAAVPCRITVRNNGTALPAAPIVVNDAATILGGGGALTILSVTADGPDWACGPVPAVTLQCTLPAASLPGGTERHFDVVVEASANGFENCASGTLGIAGTAGAVFGRDCDQGGISKIRVEKTGDAECELGQPCTFAITVGTDSPEGFSGEVRIIDALGIDGFGAISGAAIEVSPPFGCTPEPTTLPINCIAQVELGAGESRTHTVTVLLPDDAALADEVGNGTSGRNCVAVIGPNVNLAEKSEVSDTLGGNRTGSDYYSCHDFRVLAEEEPEAPQCSNGMELNNAGRCVCPAGTTFRSGECRGGPSTRPVPPAKPQPLCRLLPGQIRTSSGDCACPRGQRIINGRCRTPEVVVPSCRIPGQVRNSRGTCACPRGQQVINGRCRTPVVTPPQSCRIPGQVRNSRGQCACPRGTRVINGACRKPVVTTPTTCPRGTIGRYPNCVKPNITVPTTRTPIFRQRVN